MKYLKLILITAFLCSCTSKIDEKFDLIVSNVNVINVETGEVSYYKDVFIKDSLIVQIKETKNHNTSNTINGTGKFLMPGLWDMHVHLSDTTYFKMLLDHGVMGVRDMGGCLEYLPEDSKYSGAYCPDKLYALKKKIRLGEINGPDMYLSGPHITGTGWPYDYPATTKEEVREAFAKLMESKVDFVKVYDKIPPEAYQEISRLSKKYNIDFAGHVSESMLLSEVSDLGQKSIEHYRVQVSFCFTDDPKEMKDMLDAFNTTEEELEFYRPYMEDAEKAIEAFKRNKTWFTPTMTVHFANGILSQDSGWVNHPLRKSLPEFIKKEFKKSLEESDQWTDKQKHSRMLNMEVLKKIVKRFNIEGIGLLAGSDSPAEGGIPGFSLHQELQLMVEEAGLSPLEAIKTATINPCRYFELEKKGNSSFFL